ncbi:MAG: Rieske 2Fe-2S domain-containing protein, partial [Burkholderiaceae bacterium]|nr:Rieske 2Fe-2S domain-containing protein [Burkholderiaceae bacterium]
MNAPEALSRRSNLDPSLLGRTAPLPIASYFDGAWFEREVQQLFAAGPNYAGSEMMVPEVGDYMTLPPTDAKVLVHSQRGVNLLSNTCRHRQGLLLDGRGNNVNIVCPLHRWTYDLNGKLLGAPDFDVTPDCALHTTPLTRWNGLLFAGPRDPNADLKDFPLTADYPYGDYVLEKTVVEQCACNWKAFVEIYIELYHFESMHPGL